MNVSELLENAIANGQHALNEYDAKRLLDFYGIPVVTEAVAATEDQAVKLAGDLGFPVVLKAMGSTLTHKTERNLVHLKLDSLSAVRHAYQKIVAEARDELEGVLLQPHLTGKREFVAGLFRDPLFGPVIMFGLGGIFTEALADVSFRLAPISEKDAVAMVSEIRSKQMLGTFRGEQPVNQEQIVLVLMGLSRLAEEQPRIAEIDINPLLVAPEGKVFAVDALVVLNETSAADKPKVPSDCQRLLSFFSPKSIAFIGASTCFHKWGYLLPLSSLASGYQGELYLVNTKGGSVFGRQMVKSLRDIPGEVELAVITVPASGVLELIPQIRDKGIKNVLLITSGFRETGTSGEGLEKELVEKAGEAGILILGPNTMGICNPHIKLSCIPMPVLPRSGSTALISQSGNMGLQFLAFAEQQCIGIRAFVGTGNEAMISLVDYLDAYGVDPLSRVIMLYVESVQEGRRLFESAQRITRKKPVVLLKGGQSQVGKRAAASHTGAIASNSRVFDAACRQAGIVQVDTSRKLLDVVAAFASLPLPKGNRVAIMTLGGGWGVLTADLCSQENLEIPELTPEIIEAIDKILPSFWSRSNPVDIVATFDMSLPLVIMEELIRWDGCDAVINLGILGKKFFTKRVLSHAMDFNGNLDWEHHNSFLAHAFEMENRFINHSIALMKTYQKPIIGVSLYDEGKDQTVYPQGDEPFKGLFYPTPARAVAALSKLCHYSRFINEG